MTNPRISSTSTHSAYAAGSASAASSSNTDKSKKAKLAKPERPIHKKTKQTLFCTHQGCNWSSSLPKSRSRVQSHQTHHRGKHYNHDCNDKYGSNCRITHNTP